MSSATVSILVDMGFSLPRAEKALQATGNKGVEQAMEWLLAHPEDELSSGQSTDNTSATCDVVPQENTAPTAEQTAEAKSLKCDVCQKLFKSSLEVEFHATKSGHSSFSESLEEKKPLTDEEKKEKLKLLEEKMRQKRKEREDTEKAEAFEKEKFRIKSGKEIAEARRKLEDLEMKKILEQRKREKEEDRVARQRVRDQIEADKAARRAKAAAESGQPLPESPKPQVVSPPNQIKLPASSSNHDNKTKLQIRLTNGSVLTQTFGRKEQLSAVKLYVEINRTDDPCNFDLMTSFPKKIFSSEDYNAPLDVLGLVPSAVLIVQKKVSSMPSIII